MQLSSLPIYRKIAAKIKNVVRSRMHVSITGVQTEQKVIALTFDDGPNAVYTPQILDLLERYQAKATFFEVGEEAEKQPTIIERIKKTGHAIGNHTWSHSAIPLLNREERVREINNTQHLFNGSGEMLFRPPWGFINLATYIDIKLLGYKIICWDTSVYDWLDPTVKEIFDRLDSAVKPGQIILLHDNLRNTIKQEYIPRDNLIAALEQYLRKYSTEYRFVTVPELLTKGKPVYKYNLLKKSDKHLVIPPSVLNKSFSDTQIQRCPLDHAGATVPSQL